MWIMRTVGFKYSHRKIEGVAQNTAGWSTVVCRLRSVKHDKAYVTSKPSQITLLNNTASSEHENSTRSALFLLFDENPDIHAKTQDKTILTRIKSKLSLN